MKFSRTLVILIPLVMTGCLEIETLTRIYPDGSLERSIKIGGSETEIQSTSFNIPRADSIDWTISTESERDDKVLYRATRSFASVAEMNKSFENNSNPQRVKIKAELKQAQGLFFTRYSYSERVWAELPGPKLPMAEYVSQAEVDALILSETESGEGQLDSLEAKDIEDRLDLYLQKRIFEDFSGLLREGARRAGKIEMVELVLSEHSDSLMSQLSVSNFYNENQVWKSILGNYLDASVVDAIQEHNRAGLAEFYQRWQFFEETILDDYKFEIELPGVLRNTNATAVLGNRMTWEPEAIVLFFGGTLLEGESSQVRIWSLVITAALFLLTLILTIVGFVRQRRTRHQI